MKIKTLLLAVTLFLSGSMSAQAAVTDLGSLTYGQTGTITESTSGLYNSVIAGVLPPQSLITLSYTLNNVSLANLINLGYYDFHLGGNHYFGSSVSTSTGLNVAEGHINGFPPSPSLVLTTANLLPGAGAAAVTNNSLGNASFIAVLFGYLGQGASVSVHYVVSQIPLPASAAMFGLGLLALAGVAYRKKMAAA